jgi:membrane-bound lytic murein transglycosylase A
VLAWVEDAVGLFTLQVQGSGVLTFPDGRRRPIGFAASNGHCVSIGRAVQAPRAHLEQASMDGIRRWIATHPGEESSCIEPALRSRSTVRRSGVRVA